MFQNSRILLHPDLVYVTALERQMCLNHLLLECSIQLHVSTLAYVLRIFQNVILQEVTLKREGCTLALL
jgi:hypothetical protein